MCLYVVLCACGVRRIMGNGFQGERKDEMKRKKKKKWWKNRALIRGMWMWKKKSKVKYCVRRGKGTRWLSKNKLNLFLYHIFAMAWKYENLCTLCNNHKYWMLINFSCCFDTSSFSSCINLCTFSWNSFACYLFFFYLLLCCCCLLITKSN